jgi:hypothetical protein
VNASVAPLRRLNGDQYRNTIKDLFGFNDVLTGGDALPPDEAVSDDRFMSNINRTVTGSDVDTYSLAAEAVAAKAVMNLGTLLGCDPAGAGETACISGFIEKFGKRAYRRPLTDGEKTRAMTLYMVGRKTDVATGVRLVLSGMLQSVNFLYLFELAPPSDAGKVVQVDNWAMASRLSFFLTGSTPDEKLLAAADTGALSTAEQVTAQAKRLIKESPRFAEMLRSFHGQWLEMGELSSAEKDAMMFPAWNEKLRAAMIEEPKRFVDEVMRGDGTLETLLTAPFSMVNGTLATFYGATGGPAGETTWQKVMLNPQQRSGLLTQAGLLANLAHENRTSYILRGKMIRGGLLCRAITPPPPTVDANETDIPPTADARTRAMLHRKNPSCASCHENFDPLGFAFENYDATGKYRTTEGGKAIDASGDVADTRALDGKVNNAIELVHKLAGADEVRECMARQWMRFALGRNEHVDDDDLGEFQTEKDDAGSLAQAMKGFKDSGWKIADLLAALTVSDSFRYQKVKP